MAKSKAAERFQPGEVDGGLLLWRVTHQWQRRQREALDPLGLTYVQYVLLAGAIWLGREGEPVTQAMVAKHARMDVMMTSQVLRALEAKGMLRREPHPTDTRAKRLTVTPAGVVLATQAAAVVEAADRDFFGLLGSDAAGFTAQLGRLAAEA